MSFTTFMQSPGGDIVTHSAGFVNTPNGPINRVYEHPVIDPERNRLSYLLGLNRGWVHRIEFEPRSPDAIFSDATLIADGDVISRLTPVQAPVIDATSGRRLLPFLDYSNPEMGHDWMQLRCEPFDPFTLVVTCSPSSAGGTLHVLYNNADAGAPQQVVNCEFLVRIPAQDWKVNRPSFAPLQCRFPWANNVLVHQEGRIAVKYIQ